jgi:hypothetical protein
MRTVCCANCKAKPEGVLHRIAQQLAQPHNLQLAAARYSSTDVFVIGERAAKEYIALNS